MKILITGSQGQLGSSLARTFPHALALGRQSLDIADSVAVRDVIQSYRPQVIFNAAAYTAVDQAETEFDQAFRINGKALDVLGESAKICDAIVVHWSTDYVYGASGDKEGIAYQESDAPDPVNRYGESKFAGEQALAASGAAHLIFRCSWVYAKDGHNFLKAMLRLGAQRESVSVVSDQWGVPTSAHWLAASLKQLFDDHSLEQLRQVSGIYHWVPGGETHWAAYATWVFECAGMQVEVRPISSEQWPTAAKRPRNSRLDCGKAKALLGLIQPDWRDEVRHCVRSLVG
ncbi:MAG: dTDP-4-dehydrorhamnose reductase [Betaproteobacteria bacterium]|nr:dTDP-4-dehydrorhamnose reductase [Betaproteobacteria bacterium]